MIGIDRAVASAVFTATKGLVSLFKRTWPESPGEPARNVRSINQEPLARIFDEKCVRRAETVALTAARAALRRYPMTPVAMQYPG
jgi:hypothetical protein